MNHTALIANRDMYLNTIPPALRILFGGQRLHLTLRDQYANSLQDMVDFDHSPSLNTAVGNGPPVNDCTSIP